MVCPNTEVYGQVSTDTHIFDECTYVGHVNPTGIMVVLTMIGPTQYHQMVLSQGNLKSKAKYICAILSLS